MKRYRVKSSPLVWLFLPLQIIGLWIVFDMIQTVQMDQLARGVAYLFFLTIVFVIFWGCSLFLFRNLDTTFREVQIVKSDKALIVPLYFLPMKKFRSTPILINMDEILSCKVETINYSSTWFVDHLVIEARGFEKKIMISSKIFTSRNEFEDLCEELGCETRITQR